ncbi:hypothetical protein MmiHf6_16060 [Methanimicrococcus hongohii]|uniref:HEAT repeat domain-containing protein n=1 Tax=Methanimicrococcus hongohii TaxID=3028295 RepID=A0AA96ZUF6_9EURY|nr:HEAT repeat domain-containing protein [Methanimicrococcus sp. Hf6]WNY24276.1 hypothetical protein MmiHf6_16060 [Methanimicrococcus sp. Hf6]
MMTPNLQNKLQLIRSIQSPTNEDLFLLIQFLTDPNENEIICAAVYPVLQNAGKPAADILLSVYSELVDSKNEKLQIRFSYAFSQIPESPPFIFEKFIQSEIPRVRQNGIIGFGHLNDRKYDFLLFDTLINDDDLETAYEAAAALSRGGPEVLNYFETIMANDLEQNSKVDTRQKSYMDSQTKIEADKANILKKPDKHVLAKVIEIAGDIGSENTLQYLAAYLDHPDERISRIAAESVQKIKPK